MAWVEFPVGAATHTRRRPNLMAASTGSQPGDFARTLRAAKRGDGRAFAVFFEDLSGQVRAFAASRGVDDPEATTNEVFLRVFSNIDTFKGSATAFTGWVFQITRNRIIDEHRARRRRPDTVGVDMIDLAQMEDWNPRPASVATDAFVDIDESRDRVAALLDQLTPEQREVVLLRVVAELSFPEIAKAMDKRPNAVRALYKRARTALAAILEADGHRATP